MKQCGSWTAGFRSRGCFILTPEFALTPFIQDKSPMR